MPTEFVKLQNNKDGDKRELYDSCCKQDFEHCCKRLPL